MLLGALCFPGERIPGAVLYLGKISYGLYVFHKLALLLTTHLFRATIAGFAVNRTFALLLSVAMAAISYQCFEKRFLKLKEGFSVIPSRRP